MIEVIEKNLEELLTQFQQIGSDLDKSIEAIKSENPEAEKYALAIRREIKLEEFYQQIEDSKKKFSKEMDELSSVNKEIISMLRKHRIGLEKRLEGNDADI